MGGRWIVVLCTMAVLSCVALAAFGGNDKRVLLRDLSAITLYNGRMTNGRRSSPVQQLNCVGGSARGSFVPQVVQCRNVGFDGTDVQWECKTDMDNAYRFGTVEVSCEGFDYPDDPYVLAGSCGLEYTLDYTKEGHQHKHNQHQYYHNENQDDYHDRSSNYYDGNYKKGMSGVSSLFLLGIAVCVMYFIYKMCLSGHTTAPGTANMPQDPPPYSYQDTSQGPPPPAGFKPEYSQGSAYQRQGCGGGFTNTNSNTGFGTGTGTGTGGGGFWTGMATGGLMGYLFGNNNGGYNSGYTRHRGGSGFGFGGGSGFGFGGGSGFGRSSGGSMFGSSSSSSSSGTRTASGFGGTKRR